MTDDAHAGVAPPLDAAELRRGQEASRERIADLQARAMAARDQLAAERTTLTSPDRAVTLTVDPAGTLVDLSFAAVASRLPPAALARTVLRTYRSATAEAVARTQEVLRELVGDGAPVLDAIARTVTPEEGS
jgi:hypothetical protein